MTNFTMSAKHRFRITKRGIYHRVEEFRPVRHFPCFWRKTWKWVHRKPNVLEHPSATFINLFDAQRFMEACINNRNFRESAWRVVETAGISDV